MEIGIRGTEILADWEGTLKCKCSILQVAVDTLLCGGLESGHLISITMVPTGVYTCQLDNVE